MKQAIHPPGTPKPLGPYSPAVAIEGLLFCSGQGPMDPATGQLLPPVVGGFQNGVGIFEGEDLFEGRPVRVRFEWSQMHTGAPRWQQAFSEDGGATWEVNWVMEMARPM